MHALCFKIDANTRRHKYTVRHISSELNILPNVSLLDEFC